MTRPRPRRSSLALAVLGCLAGLLLPAAAAEAPAYAGHAGGSVQRAVVLDGVRVRLRAGPAAVVDRPETVPEAPAPRAAEPTPQTSDRIDLRGRRVLIVEDAVLLALELETGLSDAGAKVIGPAYELEEAMALLDQEIDAAVLVDEQ